MNKKLITILIALSLSASIVGCTNQSTTSGNNTSSTKTETTSDTTVLSKMYLTVTPKA